MSINIQQPLRKQASLINHPPQPHVGDLPTRPLATESLPQRQHIPNKSLIVRTSDDTVFKEKVSDAFSSLQASKTVSFVGETCMKGFLRSKLILPLVTVVMIATAVLIPLSGNAIHSRAASTDLYVNASTGSDSNNGSQSAPFATIEKADSVVTPGTTVHVAPGTYTESTITVSQSGTATAPITFVSDTPLGAKIADSSWHAFYVTGNYITIKGFEIYMTNPGTASAIIETHGSNETITGNFVHDIDNSPGDSCFGGAAIDAYENNNITVSNNKIAHVGPSTSCNKMHGIYIGGSNNVVVNNIAWDISGWCYQGWPTLANSQIMNNDGDDCRSGGIIIGWDGTTQPQTNNDITGNNVIRSVTGNGIRDCCSGTTPDSNMQYLNNDVYGATDGNYFFYQSASVNTSGQSVDPLYMNWIAGGGGDYHLQATSPLINAGTSQNAPSTDFDGNTRLRGYQKISVVKCGRR